MAHAGSTAADRRTDVIIVGGGASGTLMAFHLLRDASADLRVTLIEKDRKLARGVAYGTANPGHLLNVPAAGMSALADEPNHFCRWLRARTGELAIAHLAGDPTAFVPRTIYGDYLQSLIAPFVAQDSRPGRLSLLHGECVSVEESHFGIAVTLADGSRHFADFAILATGHDVSAQRGGLTIDPWTAPREAGVKNDDTVLIVGTGLTMIDYVLSLASAGHKGPIVALSRRGVLPLPHRAAEPLPIDRSEVPFGAPASELLRWLRGLVDGVEARGGDWRSVVDGIRPFNQQIWQNMPATARRSFLRHARAWWNVHRHRMAPEVEQRIAGIVKAGQLNIMAAKVQNMEPSVSGLRVHYRRRGEPAIETLNVDKVVDCRGVVSVPFRPTNPALCSLIERDRARLDPLQIGIDVATDCAIVGRSGKPSSRLYAVGPIARAGLWEITAVPEIRSQCAELAARITDTRLRQAS